MPSQVPTDRTCLDRIFTACQDPLGMWVEGEVGIETPVHDVLKAVTAFSAYMAADILKQNMKQEVPYDLIATLQLWYVDSLRVALASKGTNEGNITLGRRNGNGAHRDSS